MAYKNKKKNKAVTTERRKAKKFNRRLGESYERNQIEKFMDINAHIMSEPALKFIDRMNCLDKIVWQSDLGGVYRTPKKRMIVEPKN